MVPSPCKFAGPIRLQIQASGGPFRLQTGSPAENEPRDAGESQSGLITNVSIIPREATWYYLDNNTDPGSSWRTRSFSHSSWRNGPAPLGYGESEIRTSVRYGSSSNRYITTYFRFPFSVDHPSDFQGITLRLWRDDGAVVYLNEAEVLRTNMPSGTITRSTLANANVDYELREIRLPNTSLRRGSNIVAIEVHQVSAGSSDLFMDFELTGQVERSGGGGGSSAVLVGAGDIGSCALDTDDQTARALDNISGTVFTLGDNVYPDGSDSDFADCYAPAWGRHRSRTRPAVGDHEYRTSRADGYYDYFGSRAGDPDEGYYSYDLGEWHMVVLNSNCRDVEGGCDAGSPQEQWLRADLASNRRACTAAYWHHPVFSSGDHGSNDRMEDMWRALYEYDADLIMAGHDHNYERFRPLTADGEIDNARGIVSFVVGTGGMGLREMRSSRLPGTAARNDNTHGVLELTLHPTSFDWQFVRVAGGSFADSGSHDCH